MAKIAVIGAGSIGFTRGIIRDVLSVPELRNCSEVALTDISAPNLDMVYKLIKKDFAANKVKSKVTATTNRREAFKNADYVFSFVRVGGLEGFQTDIDIPLKYGVDQCVGDTLSAGGIMYAQRTIHALLSFMKDMSEVASPNCHFINHANPMAMNTWACSKYGYGVDVVGLCHGVEGGWHQIADVLGVKKDEVDIIAAGLNHQTWYTHILCKGKPVDMKDLLAKFEKHPVYSRTEKVRIDMFRRFGLYTTESNGHCSEYVPWYRKRPEDLKNWIDMSSWINGETGGYLRVCTEGRRWFETEFPQWLKGAPLKYGMEHRGGEHGAYIIESLETGRVYRGHFNLPNRGVIPNLPDDAVVEVPGFVDKFGINTPKLDPLPLGPAAVLNASINVQRMGVEAAVSGDDDLLRQAMMMDPLVSAVCNPPEIWQMVDEMLVAQARWLPQYKKAIAAAKKRLANKSKLLPVREGYIGAARVQTNDPAKFKKEIEQQKKKPLPRIAVPRITSAKGDPKLVDWNQSASADVDRHVEGYESLHKAQVRVAHDGEYLYVGILDECDKTGLLSESAFDGDRWELFVGTKRGTPYHQLGVNCIAKFQEVAVGKSGGWKSGVKISSVVEPHAWRLNLALPLKSLVPGGAKAGDRLYVNFIRGASGNGQPIAWSPVFGNRYHSPDKFGEVTLA